MEIIKAKFNCSMDALYEGCDQLVMNVLEELVKMAAFKAKYTVAAVDDFKAKIGYFGTLDHPFSVGFDHPDFAGITTCV